MKTLKQLRQEIGLTQKELSKRIGVHYSILSKIEKGRRGPTILQRKLLESFFGEPFEYISDYEFERAKRLALEERVAELEQVNNELWLAYSEASEKLRKIEQLSKGY